MTRRPFVGKGSGDGRGEFVEGPRSPECVIVGCVRTDKFDGTRPGSVSKVGMVRYCEKDLDIKKTCLMSIRVMTWKRVHYGTDPVWDVETLRGRVHWRF